MRDLYQNLPTSADKQPLHPRCGFTPHPGRQMPAEQAKRRSIMSITSAKWARAVE